MRKGKELNVATAFSCNNNCIFCFDRRKDTLLDEITNLDTCPLVQSDDENKYKKILIKNLRKVSHLVFTLGEPTINKNLKNLVKIAKEIGYKKIIIVTNGRLLGHMRLCEELVSNGVSTFNISIHGHNKKIHEAHTRHKRSFIQTIKGLSNLSQLKKKYDFNINTISVITKINYAYIIDIIKFLLKFKIDSIQLNPVIPIGNTLDYFDSVVPRYSEVALEIKRAISKLGKINLFVQHMPICLMPEDYQHLITESYIIGENKEFVQRPLKIKREMCQKCAYFNDCEGIWKNYVDRMGWNEFNPVIKKLPLRKRVKASSQQSKLAKDSKQKSEGKSCYNKSLLMRKLSTVLKRDNAEPLPLFEGFIIDTIKPLNNKEILVCLKKNKEKINLLVENKNDTVKYFTVTNKFAISYKQDFPLNSSEKITAVHSFAKYIKQRELIKRFFRRIK